MEAAGHTDGRNSRASAKDVRGEAVRWTLPGLAPMTRVLCSFGQVHAAALRERDMVRTKAGPYRPIKWLDRIKVEPQFMDRHPDAMPVMIRANSFGPGHPVEDVMLSPGQVIATLPGSIMKAKPAVGFLNHPGVFRKTESSIVYTMFDLGEPAEISVEGLWIRCAPIRAEDIPEF